MFVKASRAGWRVTRYTNPIAHILTRKGTPATPGLNPADRVHSGISLIAPSDVTIDRHIPTIHKNPALPRQITHSTAPEFNGSGIRNSTYVNKRYKKDVKTLFCLDASV
jgi:hypothetical protein